MARAAVLGRLTWQLGEVAEVVQETPRVASLVLAVAGWPGHLAGQHVDVRLTAEDGYQTQRSYSIASAPEAPRVVLTVERLEDGEVSPYLVGEVRAGDKIELRGPIGGYFVWQAGDPRPLLLVAGGSGIVPLMAMVRHHAAADSAAPVRLLYSSRSIEDVIYKDELATLSATGSGLEVSHSLTRSQPPGWEGYARRIDGEMIAEVAWPRKDSPAVFICGPTAFVETASGLLVELGYDAGWIRTERFGATGG
ncbi:MAG TPA: ferredoxin reductase [Candidatus Acidoferrum sp.]|jgi:ferredoxin-NADP reductase|nr:ferredoxin reductase [Candidatus Acidoferrum sp.]